MPITIPRNLPQVPAGFQRAAPRIGADRLQAILMRAIIIASFVFMIFPAADLAVSRWFATGAVFPMAENPFLIGFRKIGLTGPYYILGVMLVLMAFQMFTAKRFRFLDVRKPIFVLASFIAGQAIVETLKPLIGRARPRHLLEFGGDADFTPVWQFAGACARNCSFASGEAAGAAASLSLLVFVPASKRRIAAMIATPVLGLLAFNRVLFGAHFLSDVVLGWLLTLLAMAWIWKWTELQSRQPL